MSRSVSLYIRHISDNTRSDDLRYVFEKYGPVRDVYIPMDFYTRQARGFAYIEFEDERDAEEAMHELHRYRLNGREIEIEYAQGDRKSSNQMRSKYSSGRDDRSHGSRRHRSRSRDRNRSSRRRSRSRSRSRSRQRSSRRRSRSRSRSRDRRSRQSRHRDDERRRSRSRSRHSRSHDSHDDNKNGDDGGGEAPTSSASRSVSRAASEHDEQVVTEMKHENEFEEETA